ncbi:heme-binding protein [Candidatus Bathyarchaeota archaeon]|nr:heme-binding protein [Candidatus Bathyarchaeota archaeon]
MVELTKYILVKTIGKIEIREYRRLIFAQVDGYGDDGFNILLQFITKNNQQRTKVKMTAPVISEQIKMAAPVLSDSHSIAFIMPETYRLETTPKPLDERVKILEVPGRLVATLRFSGHWSDSIFNQKSKELTENLARSKVKTTGNVFIMRYIAPFTPWFLRRNEVAIEVELT